MITELVIATFQKPRYLATVLQSLLKQHCLPSEICIADDGSDRDTENVIQNSKVKIREKYCDLIIVNDV